MSWWGRFWERWLGYEPVGRWGLCRVDAAAYRRGSLPARVPLPRGMAHGVARRTGSDRLPIAQLAEYARLFLTEHPRHPDAAALRRLVAKGPLSDRIEAALRERRWSEADPVLGELLEIDPGDARARFLLGVCRLQAGDTGAAQACFDRVAERMAIDADYHAAVGRLREATGRPGDARASYRRALELQPGHEGALERLHALGDLVEIFLGTLESPERAFLPIAEYEAVIARTWETEPRDLRFFLEGSHQHLRTGQPGLARLAAEKAIARLAEAGGAAAAERIEARAALCRALIALERLDDAQAALDELEAEAPDSVWTASCRGHLQWARGNRADAALAIRQALAIDPNRMDDLRVFLDPRFPDRPRDLREALNHLLNAYPQSYAVKSVMACAMVMSGERRRGVELAAAAVRLGAGEECLLDITGTLGKAGLDADVCRVIEIAGGWERFLPGDPFLRANLAASLARCGRAEPSRALWRSVRDDESVHPTLRLRARDALDTEQARSR
jgi:tetratricopeptide (TPR) repeat protein